MNLTLIGDVHGHIQSYEQIASKCEFSLQLGDMAVGFRGVTYPKLNPIKHKFIHGNHDNPKECEKISNYLGRSGLYKIENTEIFYISGAYSVDKAYRTIGVSWWENEELSHQEMVRCTEHYAKVLPKIVISHDCPTIVQPVSYISKTTNLLDSLWKTYKPNMWFFGHHHLDFVKIIDGCEFHCLNELSTFNLKLD